MDQVYKNVLVTIAASSASPSHNGLLQRSPLSMHAVTLPFHTRRGHEMQGNVYV